MGGALARACRQSARAVPAGRPGGNRHDQPAGIPRGAVCDLARRAGRGADERQTAQRGVRLHHRGYRRVAGAGESGPRRRCRPPRPHHRNRQRRVAAALRGRRHRRCTACARRSRLAVLHQRHHRPAERRDADARHHDGADARLFRRDRTGRRAGPRAACRTDVARLGMLRAAVRRHGRRHRRSRKWRVRSCRDQDAARRARQRQLLCRADHGEPADPRCGLRRSRTSGPAHHHLWRRTDASGNPVPRDGPAGAEIRADLRSGRSADDHHGAVERDSRRPDPAALAGDHRLGRPAARQCRSPHSRRRRPRGSVRERSAKFWFAAKS